MKLHEKVQRNIERVFFKGKSTKSSEYVTYVIGNIVLMLVIFYVLLNTFAYDWTGQLYPVGSGYRLDFVFGNLDNVIPFVPQMVIFYVYLFYSMVILTMLYFAFIEYKRGYALGWSLVIINAVAVIIYIIFPVSTYWWRQDFLSNPMTNNFWATQVYNVWASDTSFNCFPSLHAAVSTICFFTWYQYAKTKPSSKTTLMAAGALIIAVCVVLSTLFVKQHYIADEIAGIALAFVIGKFAFKRLWNSEQEAPVYLKLTVYVDASYRPEGVKEELTKTFNTRFSRPNSFSPGQSLSLSEVIETIVSVSGVDSVHIDEFTRDEKHSNQKTVKGMITVGPDEVIRLARVDFTVALIGTKTP